MAVADQRDPFARLARVLDKLARHGLDAALTGGVAMEAHLAPAGQLPADWVLNDLDLVVADLHAVPRAIADGFLVSHIHPHAPPGRMLVQLVDPDDAVRVDVFSPFGAALARTERRAFGTLSLRVVSFEDFVARKVSVLLSLDHDEPVPAKHARDFLRLHESIDLARVDQIWPDYRKPNHPATYREACARLLQLIRARPDLFIDEVYSQDVAAVCPRCAETEAFRLAPPQAIVSILGYC